METWWQLVGDGAEGGFIRATVPIKNQPTRNQQGTNREPGNQGTREPGDRGQGTGDREGRGKQGREGKGREGKRGEGREPTLPAREPARERDREEKVVGGSRW